MDGEMKLSENQKSYANIPEAVFVDDVDAYMALPENGGNAEKVLRRLDEQHSKYKFMEYNLIAKRKRLRNQIPDLSKSLSMIHKLKTQTEEMETEFLLSDQIYIKSVVSPTKTVCLWLGANVMLEFSLEEAEKLLTSNISAATKNLGCVEHDLDFVRDQFTTTEVNLARVYNWDIKRRKLDQATQ